MPLTPAAPRQSVHLRDITLRGYQRADGALDIEAHMTDTKPYSMANQSRGWISAGEALHDMWMRLTITNDKEKRIKAVEVVMDGTPYSVCPGVVPNFQALVGLSLNRGFLKSAMERLAGSAGCTHLRELLQPLSTVTFQTMLSIAHHDRANHLEKSDAGTGGIPAPLANTCYAYNTEGPLAAPAAKTLA